MNWFWQSKTERWRIPPSVVELGSLAEHGASANRTSVVVRWDRDEHAVCMRLDDFLRSVRGSERRVAELRLAPILLQRYREELDSLTDWSAVANRARETSRLPGSRRPELRLVIPGLF